MLSAGWAGESPAKTDARFIVEPSHGHSPNQAVTGRVQPPTLSRLDVHSTLVQMRYTRAFRQIARGNYAQPLGTPQPHSAHLSFLVKPRTVAGI